MSNLSQDAKKIPAVRTYAMDLEMGRQERSLSSEEKVEESKPKAVEPVVSAPKKSFEKNPAPVKPIPTFKAKAEEVVKPVIRTGPSIVDHSTKNTTFIVDNEDAAEATVITDLKHNRFKLFPAIFSSLKKWFEDKKSSYTSKKAPKYSVPETSRRKGVIQKATSASGKMATADFSSIQDRIRQRNEENKNEIAEPKTIWTANTEPGYLLLEAEEAPQITNVTIVPRKSFQTNPTPEIEVEKEEPIVAAPVVEPVVEVQPPAEPVVEIAEEDNRWENKIEEEPVMEVLEEIEIPEPPKTKVAETVIEKQPAPHRFKFLLINTNLLTVGVSGLVIAIIIVGTIGYYRIDTITDNNPQAFFTQTFAEIIDAPHEEVVVTSSEKNSYITTLFASRERKNEVTQLILTDSLGKYIPTQDILNSLQLPPDQNFKQSITEVRFGFSPDSSPFMLIQAKDKSTALGGLLSWETTIHRDFNKTFSLQSFIESGKFVDGSLGGHDVRVLKTGAGSEVLIYGLIGNIIIITTDSTHFSELSNLIK